MRAREIIQEDYNQSLQDDLNNILISAKGSGASKVKTGAVVNQLQQMGYAINIESILTLLINNPSVQNATSEMIMFAAPENNSVGNTQDSASQVSDMAQRATKI